MLHPVRYERAEPARVRPNAIFAKPYEELVLELRHNLTFPDVNKSARTD